MAEKRKADDISEEDVVVTIEEATAQATKALRAVGWDAKNAALQAEIMVYAETHGNNQGLVKLLNPSIMAPAAGAGAPAVERDAACSAVVNGHQCPGMLALVEAVDLAIAKCSADGASGVALVGCHNTSTSSGQLAYHGAGRGRRG